MHWRV